MKIKAIEIAQQLRKKGINCQMDLMKKNLSKQLEYADSIGIPFVVLVGEQEVKKNKFKLKDMVKKTERELTIDSIIESLK
jgi:histidyl-tRNA synthetase